MTSQFDNQLKSTLLGKDCEYTGTYSPNLLCPLPRQDKRLELGIQTDLPFYGADIWNAYELSWLNTKGKPLVAIARISIPCESPNIIESKSMKLYLNSFNMTHFSSSTDVQARIQDDLSSRIGAEAQVNFSFLDNSHSIPSLRMGFEDSLCIDSLDVSTDTYLLCPDFLTSHHDQVIQESLHSHLLRSCCYATGQPDWASIKIDYEGPAISHEGLLQYLMSFRLHQEFHEQCVERIFMDIHKHCSPMKLTVDARYTRRGGLDINPYRSTDITYQPQQCRLMRQ